MAKTTQRAFALSLAILFLITTVGFTGVVLWQMQQDNKKAQEQTSQNNQANQQQQEGDCQIGQQAGEKQEVPEVYKPEGDVTELQKTDLKVGSGEEVQNGDCLQMKYHGTLASNGNKFDGNYDQETTLQFQLGGGQVIPGWEQGIEGMRVGGTRRIVIPSDLAYGEQDSPTVPANSDLVFTVTVVDKK